MIAFSLRLLKNLADKYNAEYVIVDFSPSSGNMNRTFIMSCDYILPVARADEFSCSSAQALLFKLLGSWFEYGERIRSAETRNVLRTSRNSDDLSQFLFKRLNPGILPFLVSAYKVHTPRVTKNKRSKKVNENPIPTNMRTNNDPKIPMQTAGVVKNTGGRRPKSVCTKGCSYWIRQLKIVLSDPQIPEQVYKNLISFNNDLVIPFMPSLDSLVSYSGKYSIPLPDLKAVP